MSFHIVTLLLLFKRKRLWKKVDIAFFAVIPIALLKWSFAPPFVKRAWLYGRFFEMYDPYNHGYQTLQALRDLRAGSIFGSGFGYYASLTGFDRFSYNMPHTISRFILQITGREFGLMGIAVVIALFGIIAYSGMRLVRAVQEQYRRNLALSMLLFILIPAVVGIMRTLNLLPLLPSYAIPFMGYGMNGLMTAFIAVGVLISLTSNEEKSDIKATNQKVRYESR